MSKYDEMSIEELEDAMRDSLLAAVVGGRTWRGLPSESAMGRHARRMMELSNALETKLAEQKETKHE